MIIAAVDQSAHARAVVREGASLAHAHDEPLEVVHVMSQSEFVSRQRDSTESTGKPIEIDAIREIAAEHADSVATDAGIDLEYTPTGIVGDAAAEIVEYAEENDASYVVVGPRNRSPTGKAVFGSTAQSILLNSTTPVVSIVEQ